jgi:tRNA/tmRNA/rRNA uracil-C5-methylase (TrmA/RlmC/RlmD family)
MALVAPLCVALTGCGDHSQQLEEKTAMLQKELERTQGDLEKANRALSAANEEMARLKAGAPSTASAPAPAAAGTPASGGSQSSSVLPSREVLEKTYRAAATALNKQIAERFKQYTLQSCTLHKIETTVPSPIASSVSLGLRSTDGKEYRIEFPVSADAQGNWTFPDASKIIARIESSKTTGSTASTQPAAPSGQGQQPAAAAPQQQTRTSSGGQPNSSTVVIQWPDAPRGTAAAGTAPPTSPAAPEKGPSPAKPPATNAVPADRDVVIKF